MHKEFLKYPGIDRIRYPQNRSLAWSRPLASAKVLYISIKSPSFASPSSLKILLISHLLNLEGRGFFILCVITSFKAGDGNVRPDQLFLGFGFYQDMDAVFGEFIQSFPPAAALFGGLPETGA
jgi:hypothetical protein